MGVLSVRLLPEEVKQLRALAKKKRVTVATLIREAIEIEWKIDGSR